MQQQFFKAILSLLLLQTTISNSQTVSSSKSFYESIVQNVESSEGRFVLYLNSGEWNTTVEKKKYVINTEKNSTVSPKISVIFRYAQNKLQYVKIDFMPAIHVAYYDKRCASLGISSLMYNSDGDVVDQKSKWDNDACKDPNVQKIFNLFEFSTEFDKLALGKPFPSLKGLHNINEREDGFIPLIYRVRFLPNENENKALQVILKDGATIFFQRETTQTNFVKVKSPSFFNFKKIDYNLNSDELEGELEKFEVYSERGQINNKNCFFNFGANSEIKLASIRFKKSKDESYVSAESGTIKCSLAKGTFLVLYNQPRANKILFDDGSSADLIGFRMEFDDNMKSSNIQFDNGSIFKIKVEDGILAFGDKGYLKIVNSDVQANLSCVFPSSGKPNVSGILTTFDVTISSGEFVPNDETSLLLGNGTVRANSLTLNSTQKPFVTGTLEKFDVTILENSTFNIPNGFNSLLAPGGFIKMNNPASPIKIDIGNDYPYGEIEVNLPYKTFDNGLNKDFTLRDGKINGKIEHKPTGAIIGKDINIDGNLFFSMPSEIGGGIAKMNVSINDGSLVKNTNQKPSFNGFLSCTIPSENKIKYITPRMTPDDRTIVFPTTLNVSFAAPITINREPFTIDGNIVKVNFSKNIAVNVNIPAGCGEHDIDKGDLCPSDKGPDDRKNWQEVVRYDVKDPGGVAHIYLAPDQTYTFDMKFDLIFDANGFLVQVSDMHPRQAIIWDRDGGKGILVAVISVIGSFIFGHEVAIPLFVLGNVVADDVANKFINIQIYSMFTKFQPRIKK